MEDFLHNFLAVIVKTLSTLGYYGIGTGMMIESACIPLPSEVVLPLGGFMAAEGRITLLGANITVAAGSLTGSLLAYAMGYHGGRPFIHKYGKYFLMSEHHFNKAEKTFNKYGKAAVFFGRLLPVIRTFISLPAGIAKMKLREFIAYSLLGAVPWNFVLIYLGYKFGQEYETLVRPIFKKFEYVVVGAIALVLCFMIYKIFFHKNLREQH